MGQAHVIEWLLEGDPAIRWQTLRDLLDADVYRIERERRKISREGWGARLLERQDREGTWGGGLYLPKWTSTTYTMLELRDMGLPQREETRRACALLLENGLRPDGGINYGRTQRSEPCITGMVLSILSHFEDRNDVVDRLVEYLLREQMPDGGWNCRRARGAHHSSMHTTIIVLEALHLYETHRARQRRQVRTAQAGGREFLLVHHLFRSDRSGEVIDPNFLNFVSPPRWRYDILRALDYFHVANAPRDKRLTEAIELVRQRQSRDGRWSVECNHRGARHFTLERKGGPSYWNTLRALRVLRWWENS